MIPLYGNRLPVPMKNYLPFINFLKMYGFKIILVLMGNLKARMREYKHLNNIGCNLSSIIRKGLIERIGRKFPTGSLDHGK